MALLTWSTSLEIGVPSMDAQHQRWVALINNLHDAVTRREGKDIIGETLDGMLEYGHTHFIDEERLMEAAGFPGYESHKKAHDTFLARLQTLKKQHAEEHTNVLNIELMMMLSMWLTQHIQRVDRQYADFLQKPGAM